MSVQCHYCVVEDGDTTTDCGLSDPTPPGQSGGLMDGVWSCNHSATATYRYKCADRTDPYSCVEF